MLRHSPSLFCHQWGPQSSYGALVRSIQSLSPSSIVSTWSQGKLFFVKFGLLKTKNVDVGARRIGFYTKFGASWTKRELRSDICEINCDKTSWPCASARLVQNDPPCGATTTTTNNTKPQQQQQQQQQQTTTQRASTAPFKHRPRVIR